MKQIVQSNNGNGKSEDPEISVTFEPLDDETGTVQDRWTRKDETTGEREVAFGEQIRDQLGIEEEDEDSESD